ncbi:MAG: flagellar motor protein MotB [Thermosulfidibacteraceae bacterium]|jgi:chemotaxis protein MotB
MDEKTTVIIVKRGKKGGEGHHGGSWKVAYADFVTAMMAFFLLMWLITMVSPEKRAGVAHYFQTFSIFNPSGRSIIPSASPESRGGTSVLKFSKTRTVIEKIKGEIGKGLTERLKALSGHLRIEVLEKGLRIEITDLAGEPLFNPGSAEPTQEAKEILKLITDSVKEEPITIEIEGHSDATPYKGNNLNNWELSVLRASSAFKYMVEVGLPVEKVTKITGYSDTKPLIKENPFDPRNRRISLYIEVAEEHLTSSENATKTIK